MKKLKRNLNELFEKGILFIKNIKRDEKTFLIFHKDADGVCSAAVTLKVLEKIGIKPAKIIASSNEEIEGAIKKIKDFDKTIILDIDISYLKKELEKFGKEILLIDHHPPRSDLNSEKIVYVNPDLFSKVYQPVSYLVFKIYSRDFDLKDVEWISALGTIGDIGFEDCRDLLDKWTDAKEKDDLLKTDFWEDMGRLNGYADVFGFEGTLELFRTLKSVDDLRKDEKIKKAYEKFKAEYKNIEKKFWENAESFGQINLVISEIGIESRAMGSFLSTNLADENPDKIIILMRRVGDEIAINARYKGKGVDLGKIMQGSAEGLDGGGGHANAAGGTINVKNKKIFKERIVRELKSLSGQRS